MMINLKPVSDRNATAAAVIARLKPKLASENRSTTRSASQARLSVEAIAREECRLTSCKRCNNGKRLVRPRGLEPRT